MQIGSAASRQNEHRFESRRVRISRTEHSGQGKSWGEVNASTYMALQWVGAVYRKLSMRYAWFAVVYIRLINYPFYMQTLSLARVIHSIERTPSKSEEPTVCQEDKALQWERRRRVISSALLIATPQLPIYLKVRVLHSRNVFSCILCCIFPSHF
jgi:hypothetical protein